MRILARIVAIFALGTLLPGCDLPSTILTDVERSSMYTFSVQSGLTGLESGSTLTPGSSIGIKLSAMTGASAPDQLSLALQDQSGQPLATLLYAKTSEARSLADSGVVLVDTLDGRLPDFNLPQGLAPGYYTLAGLVTPNGGKVQRYSFSFFVASSSWELGGVSVSPSMPLAGGSVLLQASIVESQSRPASVARNLAAPAGAVLSPSSAKSSTQPNTVSSGPQAVKAIVPDTSLPAINSPGVSTPGASTPGSGAATFAPTAFGAATAPSGTLTGALADFDSKPTIAPVAPLAVPASPSKFTSDPGHAPLSTVPASAPTAVPATAPAAVPAA
ncbi:MAG: hypothetical protein ACOYM2_17505, partial [Rectinemataceae bacterium]